MKHSFLVPLVFSSILIFFFGSCNEYTRIQKSTDVMEKYSYAKKYYNTKKYSRAIVLLEEIVPYLKGSSEAENSLYLQAQTYYALKDYQKAQMTYREYYTTYPSGKFTEEAKFYSGYGISLDVPDPRLDQSKTYEAIRELQSFIDSYPQSPRASEARKILFKLQEQLAYKELLATRLYYNLGNYLFNNYESSIITARNALKSYPYSEYKEDFHYYIVSSLYEIAKNSIIEKQQSRLRDLRDEYYNYLNEFPQGKYFTQLKRYFEYAQKHIREE